MMHRLALTYPHQRLMLDSFKVPHEIFPKQTLFVGDSIISVQILEIPLTLLFTNFNILDCLQRKIRCGSLPFIVRCCGEITGNWWKAIYSSLNISIFFVFVVVVVWTSFVSIFENIWWGKGAVFWEYFVGRCLRLGWASSTRTVWVGEHMARSPSCVRRR